MEQTQVLVFRCHHLLSQALRILVHQLLNADFFFFNIYIFGRKCRFLWSDFKLHIAMITPSMLPGACRHEPGDRAAEYNCFLGGDGSFFPNIPVSSLCYPYFLQYNKTWAYRFTKKVIKLLDLNLNGWGEQRTVS